MNTDKVEARLYGALAASDTGALGELLSADFTHVHAAGFADTKQEYLAGHRSGVFRSGTVRRLGGWTQAEGDLAVTVGAIEVTGPGSVALFEQTLVWIREDATWRLLLRQLTKSATDQPTAGRTA
ncbi:MAG TPA: nuclear transport factor 2 family protein [Trebonia sp.]|nr:nuclear transport factor 2 family protein [Trebonia sp.]